jgi:hydroxyacylglutathione hydrolase
MLVRQIYDGKLAQYAYLVGCPATGEAAVIDPERDIDRYIALAESKGLRIVAAIDTHIHADYLSGLREFAERGVKVYASDEGAPDWRYEWLLKSDGYKYTLLKDGDTFRVGNIEFRAVHTPGHTPEHMSYMIRDTGSGAHEAIAMATGDFVFVGDVGRPDLLETAAGMKGTMEKGARQLYHSLDRFRELPEFLQVWPAHGAGSACGKALGDIPLTTVGYELRNNPSVKAASSESRFVDWILTGQPEPPPYFARMKRDNRAGPRLLSIPKPRKLDLSELLGLAGRTDVVVLDTRDRDDFHAGHLPASILAEHDYQFSMIAGSFIEENQPIYLVVPEDRLDESVRDLIRIGLDDVRGFITPALLQKYEVSGGQLERTETIDMQEMERRRIDGGVTILDVRGKAEYELLHVPDALNIAHTRLLLRLDEVPRAKPLLVHCNSGGRSAAAVSLLVRFGYQATQVNDRISNWSPAHPASAPV